QSLGTLRRILGSAGSASERRPDVACPSIVLADRVEVRLDSRALTTDVGEFERALGLARQSSDAAERAQRLARAADLYRGELLPGYYEDWIGPERERLAQAHVDALCRPADA